jgi:hypothetical protein
MQRHHQKHGYLLLEHQKSGQINRQTQKHGHLLRQRLKYGKMWPKSQARPSPLQFGNVCLGWATV